MTSRNPLTARRVAGLLLGLATLGQAHAADLLSNGTFNQVGPWGPMVVNPPGSGNGATAALDWLALKNTDGTTITELLGSRRVPGGKVMRVQVDGERNGLQQLFGPFDSGPTTAYACVWIYLVSGSVGIGVGNGGATNGNDVQLNKKGSWEALEVSNAASPANSIVIASVGGPADFYVESARVDTTRVNCKPQ